MLKFRSALVRRSCESKLRVPTGTENASSTGIIKPNGLMQFTGGSAFTTGALSLDGKEAGYFFEKPVPAGQLSGITLWGR